MKRPLDQDSEEAAGGEEEAAAATTAHVDKRSKEMDVKTSDVHVMKSIQEKYLEAGNRVNEELKKAKEAFLMSYLKKTVEKIPETQNCIDTSDAIYNGYEGFLKMFSYAKMFVQQQFQMKNMLAFNSIFDTVVGLVGKGIHDRFVTPYLSKYMLPKQLNEAYDAFQTALVDEDQKASTELHCITYIIQNEMEKEKPLRIPNPLYNRFTQQVKAVSRYVTSLLTGFAIKATRTRVDIEKEDDEEEAVYEMHPGKNIAFDK